MNGLLIMDEVTLTALCAAMKQFMNAVNDVVKIFEELFNSDAKVIFASKNRKPHRKEKIFTKYDYIPVFQRDLPYQRRMYGAVWRGISD